MPSSSSRTYKSACKQSEHILPIRGMYCYECNHLSSTILCPSCKELLFHCSYEYLGFTNKDERYSWGVYEGVLTRLLTRYKSNKDYALAFFLARLLYSLIEPINASAIIPVPASYQGYRQRGFDHMALLSKILCRKLAIKTMPILRQTKKEIIIKMHFQIPSEPIILLDDIYTTGKTTNRCIELLTTTYGITPIVVTIATS